MDFKKLSEVNTSKIADSRKAGRNLSRAARQHQRRRKGVNYDKNDMECERHPQSGARRTAKTKIQRN